MLKLIGYTLFIYSWIAWAAIASLPFLGISLGLAAAITTGLLISGETAFVVSLALLGSEFWNKIKSFFSRSKMREANIADKTGCIEK